MTEFEGLRAIVTGGSSGIGKATVKELAARGATVAIVDMSAPHDSSFPWYQASVTKTQEVAIAIEAAVEHFGGLDILINNAGIGAVGTVETATEDEWRSVLDVNVIGIARVSAQALPHLRKSPTPVIINVCSIAATAGLPARAIYSASKGAVLSLTQAMAADHCHEGIRVNCVNPGTVNTPWVGRLLDQADDPTQARAALEQRQPLGRLGTAEEVAYAIACLASPRSAWTTGTAFAVDGGMSGLRVPAGAATQ